MFGGSMTQNPKVLMVLLLVAVVAFIIALSVAIYYGYEYNKLTSTTTTS